MYMDALDLFCYNQNLAQAVGSYDSTNILDIGLNGIPTSANGGGARDLGIGDDPALKLFAAVGATPFTSGGAATMQALLQGAPDNGAGAPGAFYAIDYGPVVPLAVLFGRFYEIDMPRIPPGNPLPRFLKMTFLVAGAAFTAGSVTSAMVLNRGDQPHGVTGLGSGYPAGISINN